MTPQEIKLNAFLVQVFNDILRLEEESLRKSCQNLSVSELHVLDAVQRHQSPLQGTGMADLATVLGVTSGTLTVAVKTLEQKGYLVRMRHSKDKRRVLVSLTEAATPVLASHIAFHTALVSQVAQHLSSEQSEVLIDALGRLHTFFQAL